MLSEHNPIAELIHQIQKKWSDEISPFPELKMVRWIIKPEEARLYEGFLKLESTEHGSIPEVLICLLTPFKTEENYSLDLITEWVKTYREQEKIQEKLKLTGKNWNPAIASSSSSAPQGDYNHQFLEMLYSFYHEMIDKNMRLVVALFPRSVSDMGGLNRWLTDLLRIGIPVEITFMIFDHTVVNHFESTFNKHKDITRSLRIDLDLDGAISRISKMGDPHSPEVKFRECILEMGQSLKKNDKKRLDEWGEKSLKITQSSGMKSLFATAHIVYAGMLFNFKQFEQIDTLLNKGLSIAKEGLELEGISCKPLLIQYYGYIASSNQLQKKMVEAVTAFDKQGDVAMEYLLPGMALTPYRQAYTLSKKHLPRRYDELIQKAFSAGSSMQQEDQVNSCFAGIAYDFLQWNEARQKWEKVKQIETELTEIFGTDWKLQATDPNAAYKADAQKLTIVN